MRALVLACVSLILLGWVDRASANVWEGVRAPLEYRTWTVDRADSSETVTQFYLPLITTFRLAPSTNLVVSGEAASSEGSETLNGVADLEFQLFQHLARDRVLVLVGLGLPSGKTGLTPEERSVSLALSQPVRGFRLREYGAGLDITAAVAGQFPVGPRVSLGAGVGYIEHGAYTLFKDGGDYKPANELIVSAGAEIARPFGVGTSHSLKLGASYRTFGDDEVNDLVVFQEGNQIDLNARLRFLTANYSGHLSSGISVKSDNTTVSDSVEEVKTSAGTGWQGAAGLAKRLGEQLALGFEAESRRFSGSENGSRDGSSFGLGPSLLFGQGGRSLKLKALYLWGTEDGLSGNGADLSGVSISLSLGLGR